LERIPLPNRKAAVRRVLIIAAVLFALTWIVNALLIGNWDLLDNRDEESFRHLREAAVIYVASVGIVFLLSLLPTAQWFFSWLFSWRIIRRNLIALAWLVTIIALFYGEEDWRGSRTWNNYRDSLIAQGEQLDFKAFVPKAIPDADNFAANPEVQSWFVRYTNNSISGYSNVWSADNFDLASPMVVSWDIRKGPTHLTDLVAWKMAFATVQAGGIKERPQFKSEQTDSQSRAEAAPAVLEALKPIAPRLEMLRAASSRPDSIYPIAYDLNNPWGIPLPHLAYILAVCYRLDLRACAELALGQTNQALNDVKLSLRLGDSLGAESILVSYWARASALQMTVHSIWEGLAEHKWSDAQLNELQTLLARYNFIADMKRPLDAERAAGILTADLLEQGKFPLNALTGDPSFSGRSAANAFGKIMPHGWYELEKFNYARLYNLPLKGALDAPAKRVLPEKIAAGTNALEQALAGRNPVTTILTRHQLLAAVMLPALGNITKKGAAAQVAADEALLACALERYHLAHGEYPDKLDALAPEFISALPRDVIGGEPYIYRRSEGSFVLYSVGWNEKDNGGRVGMKGRPTDVSEGDWVWGIPPKRMTNDE
jgi:hypothetical protein